MIWSDFDSLINNNKSFLISSHIGLDGDCIGSQLAMYWYLTSLGKIAYIYNHDSLPCKFSFLKNSNMIKQEKPDNFFDILIALDCSNPERMGWKGYKEICKETINIDHHRDNVFFGNLNIVKPDYAATGQLIYEYFVSKKLDIPDHVAEDLFTAILTDTGAFRFLNTNGKVFRMCADLSDRGANSSKIYDKIYASFSTNGLLLQSKIWSTLSFYLDGKICVMEMPYNLILELGATYGDSEGMADLTIIGEKVEVGMLIKYNETETHFSLRSKGKIDVGKIAQNIEGGGCHFSAAGCTMKKPYKDAKEIMLNILEKEIARIGHE